MARFRRSPRVLSGLVAGCALLLAMMPGAASAHSTATSVVSINYAHWGDIYEIRGTQALINAFNKSHPTIKVHLQAADWNTYWTKLPTQMVAGQAPDAFFFDEGYYQTHYVRTGRLLDLDPLIERDHIDMHQFWPQANPSFQYHGRFYQLPSDMNVGMLLWNKTLFQKAGLRSAPTSWQQLLRDAQLLTLDDKGHNATQAGFDAKHIVQWGYNSYEWLDFIDEPLIVEMGGQLWSQPETGPNVRCLIDTPQGRQAVQFLTDLIYRYHVSPTPSQAGHYQNIFISGKVAMNIDGTWELPPYLQNIHAFKWDIAPYPSWNGRYASSAQSLGNSIYADTPHKEAAWTLVKWLSSPAAQNLMYKNSTSLPARASLAYSRAFLQGKPSGMKAVLDAIKYTLPYIDFPHKADAFNYVDAQLALAFSGTLSPAAATKKAAAGANAYLQGRHP